MQTALLPGLIRTLEHARLQYFWVKGEHSMPNKEILHSVGEPGLRLAWRSKYGLSRLLNFQINIRILKSSKKNIKEIPCFSLMGFFSFLAIKAFLTWDLSLCPTDGCSQRPQNLAASRNPGSCLCSRSCGRSGSLGSGSALSRHLAALEAWRDSP